MTDPDARRAALIALRDEMREMCKQLSGPAHQLHGVPIPNVSMWASRLDALLARVPEGETDKSRPLEQDEIRLSFQGASIPTQRLRIVTAHLSDLCGDFVCVYHTGGDDSVESMLWTNEEARYVCEVLQMILAAWETPAARRSPAPEQDP